MDKRYEVYCLADRHFYETPDRLSALAQAGTVYATARRAVPAGWRSERAGDWLTLVPVDDEGTALPSPQQGWKIHVSATRANADEIAAAVWDYCVPRRVPFKFVPGPPLLLLRNSKYAGRDKSGKFVTVYPADEQQLHTVLRELGEILDGREGPYILTDLRWGEGPLYVRYGAFTRRVCDDGRGRMVSAIEDGEGRLVPDSREPAFKVPSWVTLPDFLKPHLDARDATNVKDLPYRLEKALHFSNGGGVYVGTDTRDGRKVVLKEGRPHAGLAADGADAVTRLEREKDALEKLSGLGIAPEVRDWFELGGHRFLVMDFLAGRTLNSFFADRHPLCVHEPSAEDISAYTRWALRIHALVEEAVAAVHERGVVFNDLHLFNIMVAPDEQSVSLLDFEAAAGVDQPGRQAVAHPGFVAPADRSGTGIDRYALACLRLALFLPVTTLLVIDREKAAHLAEVIAGEFPEVPREFLDQAVAEITGAVEPEVVEAEAAEPEAAWSGTGRSEAVGSEAIPGSRTASACRVRDFVVDPSDWPRSRDSMTAALLTSATPERDDRLFPGDVGQFAEGGGLGLAYGAAGVLYALAETGAQRYEDGEHWLLKHTDPVPKGTPLGLHDGIAGIAHVLDRLGHRTRALDLVGLVLEENWERLSSDLYGGLAGLGLALDGLARSTGERDLDEHALRAARILASRMVAAEAASEGAPGASGGASREGAAAAGSAQGSGSPAGSRRAGLLHGAAGPALLFLRLYDRHGAPGFLDLAAQALRADLARCVPQRDGGLAVDEGWRTMPYLGDGSVGIGMVLDDYLTYRDDEQFAAARTGILTAASSRFCAHPGLVQGRAGMILHLSRTQYAPGATEPSAETAARLDGQIDGLGWFAMPYERHLAFPGNQLLRLSMDLHTGTAGCLLALGAALDTERPPGARAHLPFLPPLRRPTDRPHREAGP
ncbi:class III lanthionine synthetase LanKC [Streptomyces flavofungini]|uniref:Class III lanthionine synthetase LanKC n=1 Tax=Streptomyces flavofungini TaxID=68200 RepID=A0ABS0XIK6_9ACTN|nr:class III lanthionine synthetase LanKC [Streptomyces flavofungini]MBJ3813048.1 class III lanthionine synthetase LanKC [Streptomyces flavofungini]GHC40728.1 serine/threonine protein kinase [Streptomyces flavofungini]